MILVAPAIFAPNPPRRESEPEGQKSNLEKPEGHDLIYRLWEFLSRIAKYIGKLIVKMMTGMGKMLSSLYKRVLLAVLRSALGLMLVSSLQDLHFVFCFICQSN